MSLVAWVGQRLTSLPSRRWRSGSPVRVVQYVGGEREGFGLLAFGEPPHDVFDGLDTAPAARDQRHGQSSTQTIDPLAARSWKSKEAAPPTGAVALDHLAEVAKCREGGRERLPPVSLARRSRRRRLARAQGSRGRRQQRGGSGRRSPRAFPASRRKRRSFPAGGRSTLALDGVNGCPSQEQPGDHSPLTRFIPAPAHRDLRAFVADVPVRTDDGH